VTARRKRRNMRRELNAGVSGRHSQRGDRHYDVQLSRRRRSAGRHDGAIAGRQDGARSVALDVGDDARRPAAAAEAAVAM